MPTAIFLFFLSWCLNDWRELLTNCDWQYLLSLNAGLNRTTGRRTPTTPNFPRVQSLLAVSIIDTVPTWLRGTGVPGKPGGFRAVPGRDRMGHFNPAARARMIARPRLET
jgi:hypothetical protein